MKARGFDKISMIVRQDDLEQGKKISRQASKNMSNSP